ncbi:MFS transporter [Paenibacillus hamazuiensis]|uniref:MFS transporter n=1 Tax=Paenibacillus hamazuiensis TaxID=2936508 RepID=UPI00200BA937|nr:MFS transporter [Paenibacillus hamazuiensis]
MRSSGKTSVVIIAVVTAICLLGDSMLYIVLPVYWEQFGLDSLWQVGVLLSANRFARLPLGPLVGWLYHRITKRSGVLLAVIIALVTTWSYGFWHGFWPLLLMRVLWGVAWSMLRLGGYLTVLDASGENNRGQLLGTYNGLWGIGSLVGMLAGGLLADTVGIPAMCAALSVLTAAGIPFVFKYVPPVIAAVPANPREGDVPALPFWKQRGPLFVLLTGLLISTVYFGIYTSTLSKMVAEHLPSGAQLAGIAVGAATLTGIVQAVRWAWSPFLSPWIGRLSDGRLGRRAVFAGALLGTAFVFASLSLPAPFWLWMVLLMVTQLGNTAVVTLMDALASDEASKTSKVAFMTVYTTAVDLGSAIGPFAGYLAAGTLGLSGLYALSGALLAALALWWAADRRSSAHFISKGE